MKKSKLNLVIDGLLLVCMSAIVGIGLLMRNVLVPGYKRWEIYNSNVELYFWGLDRHEWGKIHFVIGLVLLALLILHIVLHWPIIVGIYHKLIPNLAARWIAVLILLSLAMALAFFSFAVKPDVQEGGHGRGGGQHRWAAPAEASQKR